MYFQSPRALNNIVPINHKDSRVIVFIDSRIIDCETIVQKVVSQARVFIIGFADDGVREISKILQDSNCLEIHIFSSGSPGCIYLGNSELSLTTLTTYNLALRSWFKTSQFLNSVKAPHLWIYSQNLDVGDVGEEFITRVSKITGAKIHILKNIAESIILSHKNL